LVAAWLAAITVNLLTFSGWYDVALRDFGLIAWGADARPHRDALRHPVGVVTPWALCTRAPRR
jgi:hypothetical protein